MLKFFLSTINFFCWRCKGVLFTFFLMCKKKNCFSSTKSLFIEAIYNRKWQVGFQYIFPFVNRRSAEFNFFFLFSNLTDCDIKMLTFSFYFGFVLNSSLISNFIFKNKKIPMLSEIFYAKSHCQSSAITKTVKCSVSPLIR